MTLLAFERAVATGRLAQIVQLEETYVPKTGQPGQTGQLLENPWESDALPGQKLTRCGSKLASAHQKPASALVQQPDPAAGDVHAPIDLARTRPAGVRQS